MHISRYYISILISNIYIDITTSLHTHTCIDTHTHTDTHTQTHWYTHSGRTSIEAVGFHIHSELTGLFVSAMTVYKEHSNVCTHICSHIPLSHIYSQTPQSIQLEKGLGCKNALQNNCIYKSLLEKKYETVYFTHAVSFFLSLNTRKQLRCVGKKTYTWLKRPDVS